MAQRYLDSVTVIGVIRTDSFSSDYIYLRQQIEARREQVNPASLNYQVLSLVIQRRFVALAPPHGVDVQSYQLGLMVRLQSPHQSIGY